MPGNAEGRPLGEGAASNAANSRVGYDVDSSVYEAKQLDEAFEAEIYEALGTDNGNSSEPVPGTFPEQREHPEQERSAFRTPTVRNTEHLFLDVAALLDGNLPEPPKPRAGIRDDGHTIFYAAQVNGLFGDPESGKTLICQAVEAEALKNGRRVLSLDLDHNGPEATISRLLMLGAPWEALRDRSLFRYVEPEDETLHAYRLEGMRKR